MEVLKELMERIKLEIGWIYYRMKARGDFTR